MNMPAHKLAKLQFKKPAGKLCDVKALELVDVLGKMVVGKNKDRHAANPGEMWNSRH